MKVIIAGGRTYTFDARDLEILDALHVQYTFTEVVSGAATGADTCGAEWARSRELRVKEYPAEWGRYGRAAGPIRNKQMIDYIYPAGILVTFPGGSGTRNVTKLAEKDAIRVIRAFLLR